MTTVLNDVEISTLTAMSTKAEAKTIGYWEIYKWLADNLETKGDEGLNQTILWLRGATEANAGHGAFSALIRAYTEKQSQLRYGSISNNMQDASDAVAKNLIKDLLGKSDDGWPRGKIPDINRIASQDATAVGNVLFNTLGDTSAPPINSAWSGTLLFSLLGNDQTSRLTSTGTSTGLDTLNDVRDVLYACVSYAEGLKAAWGAKLSQPIIDAPILGSTIWSYLAGPGTTADLWNTVTAGASGSVLSPAFLLIQNIGPSHFLDMIMGAVQAKPLTGTTTAANFETSAKAFFSNYTPTQLQSFKAELLPTNAAGLTAKGKSDVNARAALMALSAISVEVSSTIASKLDLYDVATGTGHISDKWLEDRASMLSWLKVKFQVETSGAVANAIDGPGSRYFDQASNTEVLIGTLPVDRKQYMFGSSGTDNLSGQDLDDHLFGGEGGDKLSGAGGADYLEGDDGNDTIDAGAGNDTVLGGEGADDIKGGAGTDKLSGDLGDDILDGGADADTLVGGKGTDKYTFSSAYGSDTIKDSDGQGSVVIDGLTMTGGKREEGKSYYEDKATSTYYYWAGGNLSIRHKGSQGDVTVQDWTNGQLGIRLLEDIPKPRPVVDPIVLDLDGDGIETVGLAANVHFDHASDGFAELTGWVGPDDGMLVRDLDGNGKIISGKELFGTETLLKNSTKAGNGFLALLELDTNSDKSISGDEAATLKVWRDANQNGVTDDGELLSLAEAGVRSIQTAYTNATIDDGKGNQHRQLGSYVTVDGSTRSAVDVWLLGDPSDSIATDTTTVIGADVAALPNIEGYGKLPSLQLAMAKDATLKALVSQFAQPGATGRDILVRDILWRWTGADKQTATSRGEYIQDARWLYVVEAFTGSPFIQVGGITNGTANPGPFGAADIYAISKRVYELLYARLGTQSYLKNVQDAVAVSWNDASSTFVTDVSNTSAILRAGIVANRAAGLAVLSDFVRSQRTFGQFTTETQSTLLAALSDLGPDVTQSIQLTTATGFGLDVKVSNGQTIVGTPQSDTLVGTSGNDVLSGDASNDSLIGGSGNDVLDGGPGADKLFGNNGADTYLFGRNSGQDTIDNFDQDRLGTEADQILFSTGVKSQDVALKRSGDDLIFTINNTTDSLTVLNYYAFAERDFFFNGSSQIESVRFADPASASSAWTTEEIRGKTHVVSQGNDRLTGLAGADIVDTQGGNDTVYGLGGNDSLTGGAGGDQLFGGSGLDTLDGGAGNDFLDGGVGDDTYWFGLNDGNDILREGASAGVADSGGTDTLRIRSGVLPDSVKINRDRTDIVLSLPGRVENQVYVTDSIRLQNALDADGANTYGIEQVVFDNGVTWTIAQIRARLLAGGDTNDVIEGYATSDELRGNGGDDTLIGNGGADNLLGDAGQDKLYGGEGDDHLDGGLGNDTLSGGAGQNYYVLKAGSGKDVVDKSLDDGTVATDTVLVPASVGIANVEVIREWNDIVFQIKGSQDSIRFQGVMRNDGLFGGYKFQYGVEGGTPVTLETLKAALLRGGAGDDTLQGYATDDSITGSSGNDQIFGRAGNDTLEGGLGNDELWGEYGNNTYVYSKGDGSDHIYSVYDSTAGRFNVLQFKNGISSPNDITLGSSPDGTLIIKVNGSPDDQITIHDFLNGEIPGSRSPVQQIQFGSGTTKLGISDVLAKLYAGTAGADMISATENAAIINGQGGNDTLWGGYGDDSLIGGAGDDLIEDWAGDDTLVGGTGNDTLRGGSSSNTYLFAKGDGRDLILSYPEPYSADKLNELRFKAGVTPEMVSLASSSFDLVVYLLDSTDSITVQNFFFSDNPYNVYNPLQRITFEGDPDVIWELEDIVDRLIQGGGATKTLNGTNGNDTVSSGNGGDIIYGNSGNDTLYGNEGNDTLNGDDLNYGNDGNDLLYGGADNDRLNGADGDDTLEAGPGLDFINGGLGNDTYVFGLGDGFDFINDSGDPNDEKINTLRFKSDIEARNLIMYQSGEELVIKFANTSTDRVRVESFYAGGDPVNDINPLQQIAFADGAVWGLAAIQQFYNKSYGSDDNDTLAGYDDTDFLFAGNGRDVVDGGVGDDWLYGEDGNDTLDGGAGNDWLSGGSGDDSLVGGDGNDTYHVTYSYDEINDITHLDKVVELDTALSGVDTVITADSGYTLARNVENLTLLGGGLGIGNLLANRITGSDAIDYLYGGAGHDTILGGKGNDTLYGDDGNDSLSGGEGSDGLYGGLGTDTMTGGDGNDTYYVTNYWDDDGLLHRDQVIEGNSATSGVDTVMTYDNDYTLAANVENLTLLAGVLAHGNVLGNRITGTGSADFLEGLGGNDTILSGGGNDIIWAGDGGDSIDGGAGNDAILSDRNYNEGGPVFNGNDTVNGGLGNDTLTDQSTSSSDVYIWGRGQGADTLTDSGGSNDRLDVLAGVSANQIWLRHTGNNLEISVIGTTDKFTINNWYSSAANRVESIKLSDGKALAASKVENLVQAMANGLTPPTVGQTTLPANYQTALSPVIAANWA